MIGSPYNLSHLFVASSSWPSFHKMFFDMGLQKAHMASKGHLRVACRDDFLSKVRVRKRKRKRNRRLNIVEKDGNCVINCSNLESVTETDHIWQAPASGLAGLRCKQSRRRRCMKEVVGADSSRKEEWE